MLAQQNQASPLDFFKNNLPRKAYSCDDYSDNKVRYINEALKKQHLQYNEFNATKWLIYDIDRATCPDEIREDKLAPEPTLFVSNPSNRHAHLFYLLKTPVHQNASSSPKAIRFAAAVDCGMAHTLDSDRGYAGLLAKNASHQKWEVLPTVASSYDLHELAEYVDTSLIDQLSNNPAEYGLGRNCIAFDSLRKWAYKAIRQGYPEHEQWTRACEQRALMINNQLSSPLDRAEIMHIAKSVAKFTARNFSKQGFSEWQSTQGKKGGIAKGKAYDNKRTQARLLRARGLSIRAIAEELQCSKTSVQKWCTK